MKKIISFLIAMNALAAARGQAPVATPTRVKPVDTFSQSFAPRSFIGTIGVGFINGYRQEFSVPAGFEKNNTSGFAPVYVRAEYVLGNHVGLAACFVYNEFYGNYYQLFTGNGVEYRRYHTDMITIYSGGLAVNYHFAGIIPVKKLDVFINAGFLINAVKHTSMPQGDSSVAVTDRKLTPSLRVGARYYIARNSSFFADAGLDKQSIFSLGYSFRFSKKK